MYNYVPPRPLEVDLRNEWAYQLRTRAAEWLDDYVTTTGAERGTAEQQGYGALAEVVVRNLLGLSDIRPPDQSAGFDIELPSGVKVDVKCRGGAFPFQEQYEGRDGLPREAKHNLFARQVYDEDLDTDVYLMVHLRTPQNGQLPGTTRQRNWRLYVCGWVSKLRAVREGVYLPRGSLTERGGSWFVYRGQEVEFYNKNLNGLTAVRDLLQVDSQDVEEDSRRVGGFNLTSVDAARIVYDLVGRGLMSQDRIGPISELLAFGGRVGPILHPNQYAHFARWLHAQGLVTQPELDLIIQQLPAEPYAGI